MKYEICFENALKEKLHLEADSYKERGLNYLFMKGGTEIARAAINSVTYIRIIPETETKDDPTRKDDRSKISE